MNSTIILMTVVTATLLIFMNHPLAIGLIIIYQTVLICLMMGSISLTFWMSYMLFLVFLGAMLVLFIYVSSVASNEMFSMSTYTVIMSMVPSTILMLTIKDNNNNIYINKDMNSLSNMNETDMMLMKFYNMPNSMLTMMMVLYLFLTMIAINKITNIHLGPLRTKN